MDHDRDGLLDDRWWRMNRRELLRVGGSAFGASALAGCVSSVPFVGGRPEVREVAPANIDRGVPTGPNMGVRWESPPFRAFTIGESPENVEDNRPHHVWIWNATGEARTIEFALTTDGETLFEKSTAFEPNAALAVVLREPRDYELSVSAGELEEIVTVERSQFDCNESATDAVVNASGVKTGTVSQSMACSTAAGGA